jgi:hypothetical protein
MERVIAYLTALMLSAGALAAGVRLAADHTSALDRFKGGPVATPATTTTTVDIGPPPAPGQAFVKGTVDKLTAEGAQGTPSVIAAPFTLTALERGVGRATIENALVSGRRTSIVWGGGTPLPITGTGGSIDVGGSKVDVDASGATWTVDGAARALKPGTYRAGAPVAVGTTGVGTPRDAVEFTADARTVVSTRGGVVIKVAPGPLELTGPGKVTATGQLQVRDQTTLRPAAGIQFGEGPYTVKLNAVSGRLELDAVLQGPLTRT